MLINDKLRQFLKGNKYLIPFKKAKGRNFNFFHQDIAPAVFESVQLNFPVSETEIILFKVVDLIVLRRKNNLRIRVAQTKFIPAFVRDKNILCESTNAQ